MEKSKVNAFHETCDFSATPPFKATNKQLFYIKTVKIWNQLRYICVLCVRHINEVT